MEKGKYYKEPGKRACFYCVSTENNYVLLVDDCSNTVRGGANHFTHWVEASDADIVAAYKHDCELAAGDYEFFG